MPGLLSLWGPQRAGLPPWLRPCLPQPHPHGRPHSPESPASLGVTSWLRPPLRKAFPKGASRPRPPTEALPETTFVPAKGSLKSRLKTHKRSPAPAGTQVLPHLTGGPWLCIPSQPHPPAWESWLCAATYVHTVNQHLLSTYSVPSIGLAAGDPRDNQSLLIPALSGPKAW